MAQQREQRRPEAASSSASGLTKGEQPSRLSPHRDSWGSRDPSSPFAFMQRFMSEMDSLFGDFGFGRSGLSSRGRTGGANMWLPQIDVTSRNGQLLVHADLPGLKQEDVKVSVHDGVLTIAGERSDKHEDDREGVYRRERSYGAFSREIALPEGVDPESIKASFDSGVLEVVMPLPKEQAPQGRSIPVESKPTSGPDVH